MKGVRAPPAKPIGSPTCMSALIKQVRNRALVRMSRQIRIRKSLVSPRRGGGCMGFLRCMNEMECKKKSLTGVYIHCICFEVPLGV